MLLWYLYGFLKIRHVKNEFFDLVKDKYLMSNKEDDHIVCDKHGMVIFSYQQNIPPKVRCVPYYFKIFFPFVTMDVIKTERRT